MVFVPAVFNSSESGASNFLDRTIIYTIEGVGSAYVYVAASGNIFTTFGGQSGGEYRFGRAYTHSYAQGCVSNNRAVASARTLTLNFQNNCPGGNNSGGWIKFEIVAGDECRVASSATAMRYSSCRLAAGNQMPR